MKRGAQPKARKQARQDRTIVRDKVSFRTAQAGMFLMAFALRLTFLFQFAPLPFFHLHVSDSFIYTSLARSIHSGTESHLAYFMSPLYPYLIAAVQALTGDADFWIRFVQCVIGSLTVVITCLITMELFSRRAALVAGAIAAIYLPFVFYDGMILIESLLTFSFALFLFLFLLWMRTERAFFLGASGILIGLAAVMRGSMMLMIPVALIVIIAPGARSGRRLRNAVMFLGFSVLCILPWTIRNYATEGVLIPVTASGGFNFYAGNNAACEGTYKVPEDIDLRTDPNGKQYAETLLGRSLNSGEVSTFWFDRSLDWIRAQPAVSMKLFLRKLGLFFHFREIEQQGLSSGFLRQEYATILNILPPLYPVILFLGIAGAAMLGVKHRSIHFTIVFFAVYVVVTVLFFVNARFRLPVMPLLIAYGAGAAEGMLTAFRSRSWRRVAVPIAIALLFCGVISFTQADVHDSFESEYTALGQAAFESRDYPAAQEHFAHAVAAKAKPLTLVNLGNALAAQGKLAEAGILYRKALAMDSTYYLAYFNIGNLFAQRNDLASAVRYWRKTILLKNRFAPPHRNIGIALFRAGDLAQALSAFLTYQQYEAEPLKREEVSQDIATIRTLLLQQSGGE